MFGSRVVNSLLNSKLGSSFIAIKFALILDISKYKFFYGIQSNFFGAAFSGHKLEKIKAKR